MALKKTKSRKSTINKVETNKKTKKQQKSGSKKNEKVLKPQSQKAPSKESGKRTSSRALQLRLDGYKEELRKSTEEVEKKYLQNKQMDREKRAAKKQFVGDFYKFIVSTAGEYVFNKSKETSWTLQEMEPVMRHLFELNVLKQIKNEYNKLESCQK